MAGSKARKRRSEDGSPLVDVLLTITIFAVASICAAYVWMPDFQRGVHTLAGEVERQMFQRRD